MFSETLKYIKEHEKNKFVNNAENQIKQAILCIYSETKDHKNDRFL